MAKWSPVAELLMSYFVNKHYRYALSVSSSNLVGESKNMSNDQELIQSDPIPCPENQMGISQCINVSY